MTNLTPSMRLKVKRDTSFLPDPNSGVYFRNNLSSFRMEGSTIDKWVEKLIPMFNGEYTLGELTEGLPGPYQDRVFEIAEVLYHNGFMRDVSQDRRHQLADQVVKKYSSQIEFLDSFVDSGAYHFQIYRQAKVLAVGSGPIFISLVSALIESGLPRFHVLITNSVTTNRRRLDELAEHARKTDPEVVVEEVTRKNEGVSSWREIVQRFDSILYVSEEGEVEELREFHAVCREEKKVLVPAICLQQVGLAGPLVHPDFEDCWESAWRRIHHHTLCKDQQRSVYSSTAGAMLANVIVFELFKHVTGVTERDQNNQFFLLNLETLEGNWHSFIPHPFVTGRTSAKWVDNFDWRLEQGLSKDEPSDLLLYFSKLTSMDSGIFHIWEEEDLKQLPLAQCCVQAVDPLSEGPAELLPKILSSGLTHGEARREAGLAGIEAYVTRMVDLLVTTLSQQQELGGGVEKPQEFAGVGAGETFAECVSRGLQRCLAEELSKQQINQKNSVSRVQLSTVEDKRCQFYLEALTTMQGAPIIGLGEEVSGFPVVWISTNGLWYGSVGLNITMALRDAVQQALMKAQNQTPYLTTHSLEIRSVLLEEGVPISLAIPAYEETTHLAILQSTMKILERNRKRISVFEIELEPFLKEELAGVFGVLLREEESL